MKRTTIAWGANFKTFIFMTEDGNLWSLGDRLGMDEVSTFDNLRDSWRRLLSKPPALRTARIVDKTPFWLWGPEN